MTNITELFETVVNALEHIQLVEKDIQEQTKLRTLELSRFLEEKGIEPSVEILNGIQYQDILTQQLSATGSAMDEICKNIKRYQFAIGKDTEILEDSFQKLDEKLKRSLSEAKEKRDRFNGKIGKDGDESLEEIEFF